MLPPLYTCRADDSILMQNASTLPVCPTFITIIAGISEQECRAG